MSAYTSGTTGSPVRRIYDRESRTVLWACRDRVTNALGLEPWERCAALRFTGSPDPADEISLKLRMTRWLLRRKRRYSRCFFFTYGCDEVLGDLLRFKPVAIEGRPAYLRNLAITLQSAARFLRLKILISSGDILDEATRGFLESFFGCPVHDVYGANDAGPLAWECKERQGHHMNIDYNVYEFMRDGEVAEPGETGSLVVTNLYNYAMPLIRYQIGDIVSSSGEVCRCGRSLPLLGAIEGRTSDFLTAADGRRISPRTVLSALQPDGSLYPYQLIQTRSDEIVLRFFSNEIPLGAKERMAAKCGELLGDGVAVRTAVIEERPRAKIRPVIPLASQNHLEPLQDIGQQRAR